MIQNQTHDVARRLGGGWASRLGLAWSVLALCTLTVPGEGGDRQASPNRTVPRVSPVPATPVFPEWPEQDDLRRARVFEEPLVVTSAAAGRAESRALARAIREYLAAGAGESTAPFEALLEANAVPSWRGSLLLNLGLVWQRTGQPTRALEAFAESWSIARSSTTPDGRAVADRAVAELAQLFARLGRAQEVRRIVEEVRGRQMSGVAAERLRQAREGLHLMQSRTDTSFRCGPIALERLLSHTNAGRDPDARILEHPSTPRGTSLKELAALSREVNHPLRMVKRVAPSGGVLVPAVVHWSVGHFAALVAERGGRYLIKDPVFGHERWISRRAFDAEASGYALVDPSAALPWGWREADEAEAEQVWGRGNTGGGDPERTKRCDHRSAGDLGSCGTNCCQGMARYSVHSMLVSLSLMDTPVGYSPPRGPGVQFAIYYVQRDGFQPQLFSQWNLGTRWTTEWTSYVTDDPTDASQSATVYLRGGGQETFTGYDSGTSSYGPHRDSRAVLVRVSSNPIRYERRLPDGSIDEYGQPDGMLTFPRRILLTRVVDARGQALSLTYDAGLRLVALSDALGQVTTLSYEHSTDPLKLTRVTDPFGRWAGFEYDSTGRLERITDVAGMQSQVEYGPADFVSGLQTPYGRTSFATGGEGADRWIEITDPGGSRERVEYRNHTSEVAGNEPAPSGFGAGYLSYRNTLYWDKRASAVAPRDVAAARILHWLHTRDMTLTGGTLESEKGPLEGRVYHAYPGQYRIYDEGTSTQPSRTARLLDDGSTQLFQYEYNARGRRIKETDPLGRETLYVYGNNNVPDANPTTGEGIDLLQVKRKNGGSYDVIASYTYNTEHQPLTVADALGKTTTYTYNPAGQVLTVTTPPAQGQSQGAVTTFTYDTSGYLTQVSGPVPGANTSFTYDAHGRRRTVTDAAGLTITYDYDALDRVTKVTYPDGTYEETVYDRLDAERRRDRLGRWTQTLHDALQRPVATRDAAGRVTQYQYGGAGCSSCSGGGDQLTRLIDANGNATSWDHDLQGRVIGETRADGSSETYTYEAATSRLKQKTDRRGITSTFEYFLDGKLKRKTYSDGTLPLDYTYDPVDGQMLTAANGTDTLAWTYDALDRVATEASTKNASTVGYTYDDAGNRTALSLNGVTEVTYGYDPSSRLTSITRGSNVFGFVYDAASRRTSMTYPNGVVTTYGYDGESRLTSIAASKISTPITSFGYTLDAVGNRTRKTTLDWAEDYRYDELYRLVWADRTAGTPARWRFAYDAVGNRTGDQTDDAAMGATFNTMNQLLTRQPGGVLAFRGSTSEPASVMIASRPAQTASDNTFRGQAPVASGQTDVAVVATDPSGNVRTNTYRVSQAGAATTYTYDSNGNLTTKTEGSDSWVYTWNAENQLTRVEKNGVEQARFGYDPKGRRVEKVAGGVTTSYTYDEHRIIREQRGPTTLKYVHGTGIDEQLAQEDGSGVLAYYHTDSLGSIVKVTNGSGAVVLTRQYDAWGMLEVGANEPGYAFTGREWDPETGLYYYRARYYDPKRGRFISEDPIGLRGGINLYTYVRNRVTNLIDPLGLLEMQHCSGYWGPAGLCCKGGRFVMCTDFTWFYSQPEGVRRCITDHEEYHVWQFQWDPKPPCGAECTGNDPCTTLRHRPGTGSQRECAAYFRTYVCLKGSTPTHRLIRVYSGYLDQCFSRPGFGMM